jgi:hypothetical protein
MKDIPKPLNTDETYAYEMIVRLDALCHMVSSLVEHLAEKEGVATTSNKVVEKKAPKKKATKKKGE